MEALAPTRSGNPVRVLERKALLAFFPRDLHRVIEADGRMWTPLFWKGGSPPFYRTSGWMACLLPQGAPCAAMTLEELIAFGVEEAICWGYCGSLQEDIGVGEVVLPSSAIREEGTSYHYLPETAEASPDPQLQERLSECLADEGQGCRRGRIWTTDAPYRETREKIQRYRQAGILAVDMEMAALFAVARVRGIALGAALVVSDHVSDEGWTPGFRTTALKAGKAHWVRAFRAFSGAPVVAQQELSGIRTMTP